MRGSYKNGRHTYIRKTFLEKSLAFVSSLTNPTNTSKDSGRFDWIDVDFIQSDCMDTSLMYTDTCKVNNSLCVHKGSVCFYQGDITKPTSVIQALVL